MQGQGHRALASDNTPYVPPSTLDRVCRDRFGTWVPSPVSLSVPPDQQPSLIHGSLASSLEVQVPLLLEPPPASSSDSQRSSGH